MLDEFQLRGEFMRKPDVVGIKEADPLAAGVFDGKVARFAETGASRRSDVADARVAIGLSDLSTRVGRVVVPKDNLPVGKRLRSDAIDRFAKVFRAVVAVHDDTDRWHGVVYTTE